IHGPYTTFNPNKEEAEVEYVVQEGRRASVRNIIFTQVPIEYGEEILKKLKNKIGQPFNPIAFLEDIKELNQFLQDQGYFFAEVSNVNEDSIVSYSSNGAEVDIHFKVNLGPLVRLNRAIFIGNIKTQRRVLEKKMTLKRGDIITPRITHAME